MASSIDNRLLARVPESSGISMLSLRARWRRERRSFGRHDPPKAKPGRRYLEEMLRRLSSQNSSMTSRLSTPRRPKIRPSSLANEILVAWNALHAYFRASAVRGCTTRVGDSRKENRRETTSMARKSEDPITVYGGE